MAGYFLPYNTPMFRTRFRVYKKVIFKICSIIKQRHADHTTSTSNMFANNMRENQGINAMLM